MAPICASHLAPRFHSPQQMQSSKNTRVPWVISRILNPSVSSNLSYDVSSCARTFPSERLSYFACFHCVFSPSDCVRVWLNSLDNRNSLDDRVAVSRLLGSPSIFELNSSSVFPSLGQGYRSRANQRINQSQPRSKIRGGHGEMQRYGSCDHLPPKSSPPTDGMWSSRK